VLVLGCLVSPAKAQTPLAQAPAPKADAAPAAAAPAAAIPADASCNNGCCCFGCWHATGDVGFYFLKPVWRSNPAIIYFQSNNPGGGAPATNAAVVSDFDYGLNFVPKISIGAENDHGFGVRVNWWQFATGTTRSATLNPPAAGFNELASAFPLGAGFTALTPGIMTAGANLRMVVFDFEATQDVVFNQWALQLSGGVRYAHISQNYNATFNGAFDGPGGTLTDVVTSGHSFNGAGPTFSVDVERRLGSSNFSLYVNTRGSLLFGRTKQSASSVITRVTGAGSASASNPQNNMSNSEATNIPVGELEIGARWERDWGRRSAFVQVGLVGQAWFRAGNSSRSTPVMGNDFLPNEGATPTDDTLGLVGFNLTAGLHW
jgi:hypothetical protein